MKSTLILAAGLAAGLALASTAQAQYAPPSAAPYPAGPPPVQYLPPPPDAGDRTIVRPAGAVDDANRGDWTLKRREDWLNHKIDQAHDEHVLGNREADNAHHELDRLRDDENHMRGRQDGQLTDNQTGALEARLDGLSDQVLTLRNDAWRRPW